MSSMEDVLGYYQTYKMRSEMFGGMKSVGRYGGV